MKKLRQSALMSSVYFLLCASVLCLSLPAAAQGSTSCPNTWLRTGKVGVSTHYFAERVDRLQQVADSFDTDKASRQASQAGAAWYLMTVHHQNWLMMAPNRAFSSLVGSDAFMSRRDVLAELIESLKGRGIKPMLYVNLLIGPGVHPKIREGLGAWPPDERLIENISAIYREYSNRYGKDVAGWWVDSAGIPEYARSPNRERWFGKIAAALRAGNPNALVAFNPGQRVTRYSQHSDYTAGEAPTLPHLPDGPCAEGVQWHAWTYLGGFWGADGTRFTDAQICRYVAKVISKGGAVTFDLGTWGLNREGAKGPATRVREGGSADPDQVEQLANLKTKLKAAQANADVCDK